MMKKLFPVLSLAIVMACSVPAEAQTMTRVNRSSVFNRAQSARSAGVQRSQQKMLQHSQAKKAKAARTRQTRSIQRMKQPGRLGARTNATTGTIVGTQREIAAQKRRAARQRQSLNRQSNRSNAHVRVIKRRLATEEEARLQRPKHNVR